jgi:Zn-dependent peptidase ImmA (M78 family)
MRVDVKPTMLAWALERSGLEPSTIALRFPKLPDWLEGSLSPTFKQLEDFAKATYAPLGSFFLPAPLVETIPIPDFRVMGGGWPRKPSPNLLETIYACQQRQEWYRDHALAEREDSLSFVGSESVESDILSVAASMRSALGLDLEERGRFPTWTDALRSFIDRADTIGILVMCSGVVLNNNRRHLDPEEFRGFALSDPLAPLVFINGADTKAAQMFTLAHELAHIWLGQSALSDLPPSRALEGRVELWCNKVAAELLVPASDLRGAYIEEQEFETQTSRLARRYKVSSLVIIRRLFEIGILSRERYWHEYQTEEARLRGFPKKSGGNFYLTQAARVSKRFARALVISAMEGQTLHRDAFQLLGISKYSTFQELGRSLGVIG